MTLQEIFDKVYRHLLSQGKQAYDETRPGCVYRSPDGLSCAIGCLIPNSLYYPALEGHGVRNMAIITVLKKAGVIPDIEDYWDYVVLLDNLQKIHDSVFPVDWQEKLDLIPKLHEVSLPSQTEDPQA